MCCLDRKANRCRQNLRIRNHFSHRRIWDFAGDIVTSPKAKQPRKLIRIPAGSKDFFLSEAPRQILWTTPSPIRWISGTLSPEVNSQFVKLYHSHPSIAGVNNDWSYTSTTPYAFMECTGATLPLLQILENRRSMKCLVIKVLCGNGTRVYVKSLPEVRVVTTTGLSKLLAPESGNFQHFVEPEVPLLCLHRPVTCSYPQTQNL